MRQAGVSEAPPRERRTRGWVDFGVDDSWEPAPRRRRILDAEVEFDDGARPTRTTPTTSAPRTATRTPRARAAERASVATTDESSPVGVEFFSDGGFDGATVLTPASSFTPADTVAVTTAPRPARGIDLDVDPATRGSIHGGVPGRRTVTIRGRGAERDLAFPAPGTARRPAVRRHERPGFKPDRAGLWAVVLGLLLVLVAATSAHGAVVTHARTAPAAARVVHVAPAHLAVRVSPR